jgi:hypothetical protein
VDEPRLDAFVTFDLGEEIAATPPLIHCHQDPDTASPEELRAGLYLSLLHAHSGEADSNEADRACTRLRSSSCAIHLMMNSTWTQE